MRKYNINQFLYKHLMQNGTDNSFVQIFSHSLTVGFLIVNNFMILTYGLVSDDTVHNGTIKHHKTDEKISYLEFQVSPSIFDSK